MLLERKTHYVLCLTAKMFSIETTEKLNLWKNSMNIWENYIEKQQGNETSVLNNQFGFIPRKSIQRNRHFVWDSYRENKVQGICRVREGTKKYSKIF